MSDPLWKCCERWVTRRPLVGWPSRWACPCWPAPKNRWSMHGKVNGWRTGDKEAVENADLWRRLDQAVARHRITWHWLKGHAGHADNERCDVLAAGEMAKIRAKFSGAELAEEQRRFVAERNEGGGTGELF